MRTRAELPTLFESRGYRSAVEVGVLRGEFSRVILGGWSGTLCMVDAWRQIEGYVDIANGTEEFHTANMMAAEAVAAEYSSRARIIRGMSVAVAEGFDDASVDAVYIDANHSKAAVLEDLRAWAPKVRGGGALCGHDYLDGVRTEGVFGVKSAVLEFFGREPDIVTVEPWPTWVVWVP